MANFVTADLIKYQAKITQQFQAGELRYREPVVFNSLRRQTEIMIPSHNEIKQAAKRIDGEVNYVARTARNLGTGGEIYNHTGAVGDSAVLIPAWGVYDDKFKYSLKQANGSIYELDEMIMAEMVNMNANFAEGLESAAATFIHTNRSGVNAYARQGSFNGTNDVFEIEEDTTSVLSTGYRAVQIAKSAMMVNKYSGAMVAYCDTMFFDKMEALANQGSGNSNNLSFQFSGVEFIKSPELDALAVALSYTKGYCVVAPFGTLAVLDWIPVQNRNGVNTKVNQYGTLIHPATGLTLGTHSYEARADNQDAAGEKQDVTVETQAFSYLSFNHAPLTQTDATPLMAFALVDPVVA